MSGRIIALLCLFALGGALAAVAQDPAAPGGNTPTPDVQTAPSATWRAATYRMERVDGGARAFLIGAVRVEYGNTLLRADHAILWGRFVDVKDEETGETTSEFEIVEIYADGEVRLTREQQFIECHQLFLDVVNDRGLFIEAQVGATVPTRDVDTILKVRAAELQQLSRSMFRAEKAWITTSPFADPGYRAETDSILAQVDPPRPHPRYPDRMVRNVRFETDTSVLYVGELPIFALPPITGNTASPLGQQMAYIKSFQLGSSRRFGPAARLTLGDDIFIDDKRWGEWAVHVQYLGKRGPGIGLDLEYSTEDYYGRFESLYQHDHGRDELFPTPNDDERGRVKWQHRFLLPEHIQLDIEASLLSDRGFLPEYYEDEFKSGKQQETLVYFKRALENRALTFLAKKRVNRFLTQTEYLPQLGYNLVSEPIVDVGDVFSVYYDADFEVANVRRRFNRHLDLDPYDTYRIDLDNKVGIPVFAGPLKVMPYGGFRYTLYGEGSRANRTLDRVGLTYGVHATAELWRIFDVRGGALDLFGLRHIVMPEIEYRVVEYVTDDPTDYLQFDAVDAFTEREEIIFGVRNRLQTIWEIAGEDRVIDVVDLDVEWTWFPHPGRDNFGEEAGNLDVDFLFRPIPELTFLTDFEYSFLLDDLEVFNATLGWAPSPEFQAALGYRRYIGVNDAVFVQGQWRFDEKWNVVLFSGFDIQEDQFQDQRLSIQRIGADWVLELEFSYDDSDNDFGFGISFTPRSLFDPRLRARSLRHEPRFADFGEGLIR